MANDGKGKKQAFYKTEQTKPAKEGNMQKIELKQLLNMLWFILSRTIMLQKTKMLPSFFDNLCQQMQLKIISKKILSCSGNSQDHWFIVFQNMLVFCKFLSKYDVDTG